MADQKDIQRAMKGFQEANPGAKYDRNNPTHVRFIDNRIRDYEEIRKHNKNAGK